MLRAHSHHRLHPLFLISTRTQSHTHTHTHSTSRRRESCWSTPITFQWWWFWGARTVKSTSQRNSSPAPSSKPISRNSRVTLLYPQPEVRSTAIDQVRKFLMPGGQGKKKTGALLPALGVQLENSRMTVAAKVMSVPSLITAGVAIPERFSENWAPQIGKSKFSIHPNQANVSVLAHGHSSHGAVQNCQVSVMCVQICETDPIVVPTTSAIEGDSFRLSEKPFALLDAGKTDREHIAQVQRYFATSQDANVFVLDFVKPKNAADGAYPVVKQSE
mmetsp:Transcript_10674/g.23735  ORF Transcript_10674/g.23735 Transcript_10674/m.23735 type:complete len:274 (+) Transcript_10674:1989-2810(+)